MLVQIPHCHQRQGVHSRFLQALPVCPIRACAGSPCGMVVGGGGGDVGGGGVGAVVDLVVDGDGEVCDDDDGDNGDNEHDNVDFAAPPCACAGS